MNNYLYLFSIGPVQSFISQARKTQDLYAGSLILSELTKTAIAEVGRDKIIFPYAKMSDVEWQKVKSMPNRFVAEYTTDDPNGLKAIGENIQSKVEEQWRNIAKGIFNKYKDKPYSIFEKQIENHLDINWLFYPIGDNYAASYQEAESLLNSVKNVRIFNQNAEKGRKCSIDGERNVKFYRLGDDEKNKSNVISNKLFLDNENGVQIFEAYTESIPLSILAKGEGLSAVSFVKRAYDKGNFPSTAEIALMNNKHNITDEKIKSLLACYEQLFNKENLAKTCIKLFSDNQITEANFNPSEQEHWNDDFDYQRLYEENITDKDFPNPLQRRLVKNVFAKLQPYFKQKYYAILVFDGDKMGEIIGGGFLMDKTILKTFQSRVSELLLAFAQKNAYLKAPEGKTVYAGGDDFLGFVNLDYLFEVIQRLRDSFEKEINQVLKNEFRTSFDKEFDFTFSAGIAIAHYKTPLSIVLKKARDMEKSAKEDAGRNAFGMAVLKHSGESHEACLKWAELHLLIDLWKNLSKKNYSNKFITTLQREFSFFKQDATNETIDFFKNPSYGRQILKSEIGRLVNRAKSSEVKAKEADAFTNTVFDIFDNDANKDFNNFSEILNIVEFMKRKNDDKK